MLSNQKSGRTMKGGDVETLSINKIVAGTVIKGDIEAKDDFRINGTLIGTIRSSGKVVLGASGSIEGEMICLNAVVEGKVKGKVQVKELLSLSESARIEGDIQTGSLSIEPGAVFTGSCIMGSGHHSSNGSPQPIADESRTTKKAATA
jgi:cytoskeletal protein CcmA (bactofilin family)